MEAFYSRGRCSNRKLRMTKFRSGCPVLGVEGRPAQHWGADRSL